MCFFFIRNIHILFCNLYFRKEILDDYLRDDTGEVLTKIQMFDYIYICLICQIPFFTFHGIYTPLFCFASTLMAVVSNFMVMP